MTKKFVTIVTTEWEVRGDVTVDRINARLRTALGGMMMTKEEGPNYAFTGEKHILELETKEVEDDDQKLTEDQKTELWGMLEEAAQSMDHDALCQYHADKESESYTLGMYEDLKNSIRQ